MVWWALSCAALIQVTCTLMWAFLTGDNVYWFNWYSFCILGPVLFVLLVIFCVLAVFSIFTWKYHYSLKWLVLETIFYMLSMSVKSTKWVCYNGNTCWSLQQEFMLVSVIRLRMLNVCCSWRQVLQSTTGWDRCCNWFHHQQQMLLALTMKWSQTSLKLKAFVLNPPSWCVFNYVAML